MQHPPFPFKYSVLINVQTWTEMTYGSGPLPPIEDNNAGMYGRSFFNKTNKSK